jgi:hypothetical protein
MKELLTAIVVDYAGGDFGSVTPEMEVEAHTKKYSEYLYPAKLNVYSPWGISPEELKEGTDLILYDYGGLLPGTSLMEDNSRRLVEYAENHPSCLIVVVSEFTYRNYVALEVEDRGLKLVNLVCEDYFGIVGDSGDLVIPDWFREFHKLPIVPYEKQHPNKKPKKLKTPGRAK